MYLYGYSSEFFACIEELTSNHKYEMTCTRAAASL
jgi:hypothetical protein